MYILCIFWKPYFISTIFLPGYGDRTAAERGGSGIYHILTIFMKFMWHSHEYVENIPEYAWNMPRIFVNILEYTQEYGKTSQEYGMNIEKVTYSSRF